MGGAFYRTAPCRATSFSRSASIFSRRSLRFGSRSPNLRVSLSAISTIARLRTVGPDRRTRRSTGFAPKCSAESGGAFYRAAAPSATSFSSFASIYFRRCSRLGSCPSCRLNLAFPCSRRLLASNLGARLVSSKVVPHSAGALCGIGRRVLSNRASLCNHLFEVCVDFHRRSLGLAGACRARLDASVDCEEPGSSPRPFGHRRSTRRA